MKVHPISRLNKKVTGGPVIPPFVTGADGALVILNGQTVNLTAPFTRQYTSVDIQAGGTLNITGNGNLAQMIVRDSFTLNGTIQYRANESNGYTFSGTTVSGYSYSHNCAQNLGGSGGGGQSRITGSGQGGAGTNGYGGGGGGGCVGTSTAVGVSNGGSNNGNGQAGQSGGANTTGGFAGTGNVTNGIGGNGTGGTSARCGDGGSGGGSGGGGGSGFTYNDKLVTLLNKGGGGGGGGHKGLHGGMIFIYSVPPIVGTGSVNVSGTNGFNGGNGSVPSADFTYGGGGGGGGAGGSGGKVIIDAPSYSFTPVTSGGSGGLGGARAVGNSSDTPASVNGSNGQFGNGGILEVV